MVVAVLAAATLIAAVALTQPGRVGRRYGHLIYHSPLDLPAQSGEQTAVVFGGGWSPRYGLSELNYDRVVTAAELYRLGRVGRLLLSSSGGGEVQAMRRAALDAGVADADIILDPDSHRTYDSCYRARNAFSTTRAVLVTQRYHLPRALYLCDSLGVAAVGVAADRRQYFKDDYPVWRRREFLATVKAWLDVNLLHPAPG